MPQKISLYVSPLNHYVIIVIPGYRNNCNDSWLHINITVFTLLKIVTSPLPPPNRDTELEFLAIIPAICIMRDTRVENL